MILCLQLNFACHFRVTFGAYSTKQTLRRTEPACVLLCGLPVISKIPTNPMTLKRSKSLNYLMNFLCSTVSKIYCLAGDVDTKKLVGSPLLTMTTFLSTKTKSVNLSLSWGTMFTNPPQHPFLTSVFSSPEWNLKKTCLHSWCNVQAFCWQHHCSHHQECHFWSSWAFSAQECQYCRIVKCHQTQDQNFTMCTITST